jgi:hypothetical protein
MRYSYPIAHQPSGHVAPARSGRIVCGQSEESDLLEIVANDNAYVKLCIYLPSASALAIVRRVREAGSILIH